MKSKALLFVFMLVFVSMQAKGDNEMKFGFSATYSNKSASVDSLLVENLTTDEQILLVYPDTVLNIVLTKLHGTAIYPDGMYLSHNYPNPFSERTTIDLRVPETDEYIIQVYDISGRKLTSYREVLDPGTHHFTFISCNQQTYVLTANSGNNRQSRTMIQTGIGSGSTPSIIHSGATPLSVSYLKSTVPNFSFSPGDELRMTGYLTDNFGDFHVDVIQDAPEESKDYVFRFSVFFRFVVETTSEQTLYRFEVNDANNLEVYWDNGEPEIYHGNAVPEHDFEEPGLWEVTVRGEASRISFHVMASMLNDILSPVSDGVEGITSANSMFRGIQVESFSCHDFFDETSANIEDMNGMFNNATYFNQDIGHWDVSKVTDMNSMFYNASSFNQDIGNWDVSNVENMALMFANTIFNQDISNWNVGNVLNMGSMFSGSSFNGNIGNWNVSRVTNMSNMFFNASDFNQDIGNWEVVYVANMANMFSGSSFNQDVSNWAVSQVTNMSGMFSATPFNQDISNWDVSNVSNFSSFLQPGKLSTEYYNNLLVQWAELNLQQGVNFWAGNSQYDGGEPEEKRETIVNEFGWIFVDGGKAHYDLSFEGSPKGTALFTGEGSYAKGEEIDIEAQPNPFFEFVQWEIPEAGMMGDANSAETTFTMPAQALTLKALFEEIAREEGFFQFSVKTTSAKTDYKFIADGAENLLVVWDENNSEVFNGDVQPSFDFGEEGEWIIKVQGSAARIAFLLSGYSDMLTGIAPIGEGVTGINSTREMFRGTNVGNFWHSEFLDAVAPDITDMSRMFYSTPFNSDIGHWNVSNVADMSEMFYRSEFNQDIGRWNVEKVADMSGMFHTCPFNQDIGGWNVINVNDMSWMFYDTPFNQDIAEWDVDNVSNMEFMFCRASAFNQNIDGWVVGKVTSMRQMFQGSAFNQNIGSWNVSNVADMFGMFENSPFNQDIGQWKVDNVTNMEWMFRNTPFNQDIGGWYVGKVTTMNEMFGNSAFDQDIGRWNVSNVKNMRAMFAGTPFNQDIGGWDVSKVPNMSSMFAGTPFNQDISTWDVSNVTNMSYMFRNSSFNENISVWDVTNVTNMSFMFSNSPFNQDISQWNVRKVTNMQSMFAGSDFNQPIGNWDVRKVTTVRDMFRNSPFDQNISDWEPSNIEDFNGFLDGAEFSTDHYNGLLINWAGQNLQEGVRFNVGNSRYDEGFPAVQKSVMEDEFNWFFIDGGTTGEDYSSISLQMSAYPEGAGRAFGRGNYEANEGVQISAVATPMYRFSHWVASAGDVQNPGESETSIAMPGEHVALTAHFVENPEETNTFDFLIETTEGQTDFAFRIDDADGIFIHWREGHIQEYNGDAVIASHDFEQAGEWTIRVLGKASRIAFYYYPGLGQTNAHAPMVKDVLTAVTEGVEGITSALDMFRETSISTLTSVDFFNEASTNVTTMRNMFNSATSFNQDIGNWDVSNVADMSGMFFNTDFNQDISNWIVSNVTDMGSSRVISGTYGMFQSSSFNQNIGNWDVSNVTNMRGMFSGTPFNQNIGDWDVSNVTNMSYMFVGSDFNQPIGGWKTGNVTTMEHMFRSSSFNQDIDGWDVSNVTNMSQMFWQSSFNQDIGAWDVSSVTNMERMFGFSPFNQNLSRWDVSNVSNFNGFLDSGEFSTDNYNQLLVEWSKLDLRPNVAFNAGNSRYELYMPAERRQYIIDQFNWNIRDGGCWCVEDADGNVYNTVMIDGREWMAENLRVERYNDGTAIPTNLSDEEWSETNLEETGAVAVYPHEDVEGINTPHEMAQSYGRLYNWYTVVDERKLCPDGWSVPSNEEWGDLVDYIVVEFAAVNDSDNPEGPANILKSCRQVDSPLGGDCNTNEHPRWNAHPVNHGTDDVGFSALPAGCRFIGGHFDYALTDVYWWSSTEGAHADEAGVCANFLDRGDVNIVDGNKRNGFSVRCIRD